MIGPLDFEIIVLKEIAEINKQETAAEHPQACI